MTTFPDRSAVRAELAALLTAALTGPGKLAQAVFGYTVKDFGGTMPALVVGSAGTDQKPFTARGSYPSFLIDLWVFVLYAAVDEKGALLVDAASGLPQFTEADSERTLDLIEAGVREMLDGNQRGATWKAVSYASASTADIVPVGNASYRRELIPLRFECF